MDFFFLSGAFGCIFNKSADITGLHKLHASYHCVCNMNANSIMRTQKFVHGIDSSL